MAVPKNSKPSKPRGNNGKMNGKALLVAQEISFAKVLAGNDKKLRDRGVKRLKKWLSARSEGAVDFDEDDFMRIWKGLFYCMWMSDKPLIQEELAESISSLVHCFKSTNTACSFMKAFFMTMCKEWKGIDQHRLDKFLMLIRRFLRQSLILVKEHNWKKNVVEDFCRALMFSLLPDDSAHSSKLQIPLGLVMHFTDIFMEELAKVSGGNLSEDSLLQILRLFVSHIAVSKDGRIVGHIQRHIFRRLIEQSPQGIEYREKFQAWKKLGFPGGTIDVMEKEEVSGEDDERSDNEMDDGGIESATRPLDPRAGRVDVELPIISFNPKSVAKLILEYRFKKYTNAKTRKALATLAKKFEKLSGGEFPLGIKSIPEDPDFDLEMMAEEAAEDLKNFEEGLKHMDWDDENDEEEGEAEEQDEEEEEEEELEGEEEELDGEEEEELDGEEEEELDGEEEEELEGEEEEELEGEEEEELEGEEDDLEELEENDDVVEEEEQEDEEEECDDSNEDNRSTDSEDTESQLKKKSSKKHGNQNSHELRNKLVNSPRLIACNDQPSKKLASPKSSLSSISEVNLKVPSPFKVEDSNAYKKRGSNAILPKRTKPQSSVEPSDLIPKKRRVSVGKLDVNPKKNGGMSAVSGDNAKQQCHDSDLGPFKNGKKLTIKEFIAWLDEGCEDTFYEMCRGKTSKKRSRHDSKPKMDPWNEPLQDGETEIFIPRSALLAKRRSLQSANESLRTPDAVRSNPFATPSPALHSKTPVSSSKKVNFVLQRNTAQATSEYFKTLKANPDIPYDASKKPSHGVLKQSPYNSPINPFYKRKLKL